MGDFEEIWILAIAEYEKTTGRRLAGDAIFRKFTNVTQLEQEINGTERRFLSFRSGNSKGFTKLKKLLAPLLPILKVAQTALGGTPYAPAAVVFSAASHLLDACGNVSKSYDAVEALLQDVCDATIRLEEYSRRAMDLALKAKMAQVLSCILEVLGTTEKLLRRKRIKQWTRAALSQDDEIGAIVDKLKRLTMSELGLVTALTYVRLGDLQERTEDHFTQVMQNQYQTRELIFSAAEERKINEELRSQTVSDLAMKHDQSMDALTKDTGMWIQSDPVFATWEHQKVPILWVFGQPGVGKTMLAARTIEYLQSKYSSHVGNTGSTSVSYLYFKDDNPNLQDCAQMLKAAAFQITQTDSLFKKHVLTTLTKSNSLTTAKRIWD